MYQKYKKWSVPLTNFTDKNDGNLSFVRFTSLWLLLIFVSINSHRIWTTALDSKINSKFLSHCLSPTLKLPA